MARGGRSGLKGDINRHVRGKSKDSEDSDDDYVAELDEVDERSDELELESEEESSFDEKEEEDGICMAKKPSARKKPTNSRRNPIKRANKRRKVTCNMDEDFVEDEFTSDEEFTADEMESLEEEEEIPMPRLTTKKRRTTMNRKSSTKNRRGKTGSKTVRKTVKKKRRITRSKKKPVLRKKRETVVSDSESYVEPSDYEFTISEEEREQMREANAICETFATNLRSSRRIQGNEVPCEPRKTLVRKGKEKADEPKNDVGKPVCGICFTEEGKNTIRGTLNCCSHYFCFGCIIEWSKVESRCPLCKQRFVTISKPARCVKGGFDLRNAVIQVPERDQVYQPSEEELRGFLNPYENVICTECHHGGDDDLMLLCDLCDSPAHTYCVGLGREVPEGNWYCDGCRPLDHSPDQRESGHATSTYENMADIDLNVSVPETPLSQGNEFISSPRYSGGGFRAPSPTSGMVGVTTVSSRRRMQHQIYRFLFDRSNHVPDVNNLRSILGVEINSRFQHSGVTDVGTSRNAHRVENRDSIPGIASTSGDGLARGHTRWSEFINQAQISTNRPTLGSSFEPAFHGTEESTNMVKQRVLLIVKRQLKSMSQDMNLSDDNFEEISRRTAETIMVAYGLEPRRLDSYEVQLPFCLHVGNIESGPINGCCLTCFENFAKDVVNMIMDVTLRPHWSRFRH